MKIASIVGARPQFIKCAAISRELRKAHEEVLVHTGQHYDHGMSEIFFEELDMPRPDYNLNVGSSTHGKQTGEMLMRIEKVLAKELPDLVLLYGDTNSTLAGALAASKLHMKIAHVEAGLRSFDRSMPEEINRILTDHISDLLFCPSQNAMDNLRKEGIAGGSYLVGDVMVDTLNHYKKIAVKKNKLSEQLGLKKGAYYVLTLHRPGNTDSRENLKNIMGALEESGKTIVFPVHPRTRKYLQSYGFLNSMPDNVKLIEPVGYLDMIKLMMGAEKIMTDSGGIQKEAYVLGVPCITLRENTEWIETLDGKWNVLVGTNKDMIIKMIHETGDRGEHRDIFGKNASKKIVKTIEIIA
jgi:UDP-N-acetylglucosamine 2-epimerase (non-hydrolysing)